MTLPASSQYWALPVSAVAEALECGVTGLSSSEAARRLRAVRADARPRRAMPASVRLVWRQIRNPLLLLLLFAVLAAGSAGEWTEAAIVAAIVAVTVGVGYWRERGANAAVDALRRRIQARALVVRDGRATPVLRDEVVAGDLILLSAGSLVPADAVLIDAVDLFVRESALTGESLPVLKTPGLSAADAPAAARANVVYMGTDVRSGVGRALAVHVGPSSELGLIERRLQHPRPETDFERGLRRFSYFVTVAMLMLVTVIFAVHTLGGRPAVETLLFSIALAVGLSPELMPAILTVNLARGARMMADRGVLVRRLEAIENLGSMDVLCTDKTGTLTEGVVRLDGGFDPSGAPSPDVVGLAALNARLSGGRNPLDDAILAAAGAPDAAAAKLAEMPFDFVRRRVSVVVAEGPGARIVTKGAVASVLEACRTAGGAALTASARGDIAALVERWNRDGTRVVAVATAAVPARASYGRSDEVDLDLRGFLTFLDEPKADAARALDDLARLDVRVKVITGDQRLVAAHVARQVGLKSVEPLSGADIATMDDVALGRAVERTDVFAEVDPAQKERILRALRRNGHVVGFLGDGINDAPAMHIADASLSVDGAVDVAREAADFVLLQRDLGVIQGGVEAGRRTFANTLKYILTTMSANLGNMLSMATASLVLPFLPMTAAQILLNNLLSDLPALGIADDRVDAAALASPPRWQIAAIARFMVLFGLVSSIFDVLTFWLLVRVFHATPASFQTGWFVESLLTELLVALVVRTSGPTWRSRPGSLLANATALVVVIAFAVPYLPGVFAIGFVPLPAGVLAALAVLSASYAVTVELLKRGRIGKIPGVSGKTPVPATAARR